MKNFFFALAAVVVLASCSKKDAPSTPTTPEGELKLTHVHHVYGNNQPATNAYTYDAQGRMIKNLQEDQYTEYAYDVPGKIMITNRNVSDNKLYQKGEAILDAQGRMTRIDYYTPANVLTFTYIFAYDADGYMNNLKGIASSYNFEWQFEIVNGNPVSVKYFEDGIHTGFGYYSYEGNIKNKMPNSYGTHWPAKQIFGKTQTLLCSEYREVDLANTTTWHYKYQFELDAAGYVKKQIGRNVLSGLDGITTYTLK